MMKSKELCQGTCYADYCSCTKQIQAEVTDLRMNRPLRAVLLGRPREKLPFYNQSSIQVFNE